MRNLFFVFFWGMGLIGMSGCECDDPTDPSCDNYDPCFFEKQEPALDFDIYQTYPVADAPSFLTDTIIPGYSAYFEANMEDAISYEWWYGLDTVIQNESGISVNFSYQDSTLLVNNPVPITLVIEYEPNRVCYPNHTGRDTITKYVHFRMLWQTAYIGRWQVYVDGDTENPYEIEIKMNLKQPPFHYELEINNLYNEGGECTQIEDFGYTSFSKFLIHTFDYMDEGCGRRDYDYSTSSMNGSIDVENSILYLSWNEGYRPAPNAAFIYDVPHTIIGYRVD